MFDFFCILVLGLSSPPFFVSVFLSGHSSFIGSVLSSPFNGLLASDTSFCVSLFCGEGSSVSVLGLHRQSRG